MEIEFECSGGFAGLTLTYRVNTDSISPKLADDLVKSVNESSFFDLDKAETISPGSTTPDALFYILTITDGEKRRTIHVTDTSSPKSLMPLLTKLRKLALYGKRP